MFRFVILSALIVSVFGVPVPDGLEPLDKDRIVGGGAAPIEQHPYIVSIKYMGNHRCGGCIYESNIIITAAHCIEGVPTNAVTVVAGTASRTSGGVSKTVVRSLTHASYSSVTVNNDIGILILESGYTFGPTIQPISLAAPGSIAPANGHATVIGWGALSEGGAAANTLQAVAVTIISNSQCSSSYRPGAITTAMVGAGEPEGGKDACQGDSGGPLVRNNVLIGVISWGNGCARPGYPGVYTAIGYHHAWILNNV